MARAGQNTLESRAAAEGRLRTRDDEARGEDFGTESWELLVVRRRRRDTEPSREDERSRRRVRPVSEPSWTLEVAEDKADAEGFALVLAAAAAASVTARGVISADADASMSIASVLVAEEVFALAPSGIWSWSFLDLDRATV